MCRDNEGSMASVQWDKGISSCCRCKGRETKSGGRFHLTGGKLAGIPSCDLDLQPVDRQWCLVRRGFGQIGVGNGGWSEENEP